MELDDPSLGRALEGASNVFCLVPAMAERGDEVCFDLSAVASPSASYMLWVTAIGTPDDRIDGWHEHVGDDLPERMAFVTLGGNLRGGDAPGTLGPVATDRDLAVESIQDPGNLTRIGVILSSYLSDWDDGEHRIGVCFDSLTTLLQYADIQKVFRFVHELSRIMHEVDGTAHYHLDPNAHDDKDVSTLKSLFDAVVELEDGVWTVTQR